MPQLRVCLPWSRQATWKRKVVHERCRIILSRVLLHQLSLPGLYSLPKRGALVTVNLYQTLDS